MTLGAAKVHATPLTFFGEDAAAGGSLPVPNSAAAEADFLSYLVGVHTEDFEGFTVNSNLALNATFGASTATITGDNSVSSTGILGGPFFGRFAISGSQYLNLGTADANSFMLTFDLPQVAFGFYGTDIGDYAGQLTISLDDGSAIEIPHTVNAADGGALYFGIIDADNPFTKVTFSSGSLSDAFGFDDLTIGTREQLITRVPEPGTLALMVIGLAGLIGLAGRRPCSAASRNSPWRRSGR